MPKNAIVFERLVSVAGAALLFIAARRGTADRLPKAATGGGRRPDDPRQAPSGERGIRIEERVTIQASPHALFEFWRKPDNMVRMFPHLQRVVTIDEIRSHWVMGGPAGTTVEWDARIINEIPGEEIAWASVPGSHMVSAGSVTFRPLGPRGTEVRVVMQYDLPTGKLGAALAWLVGRSPDEEVRDALRHLKQAIETVETPADDEQPSDPRRTDPEALRAQA